MQPVNGNPDSDPSNQLFVLDESLTPAVAKALKEVGYRFVDVQTAIGRRGVTDPEIIEWCKEHQAVWVHADDRARKQHKVRLQTSGIRTLWVYRTQGQMTGKEQLRILAYVLPLLIREWDLHPAPRHYRASATNPFSKPTLKTISI